MLSTNNLFLLSGEMVTSSLLIWPFKGPRPIGQLPAVGTQDELNLKVANTHAPILERGISRLFVYRQIISDTLKPGDAHLNQTFLRNCFAAHQE